MADNPVPTCIPKLLPVDWFDDRLKVKGCPGFAVINNPATYATTQIGYMLAAGVQQVLPQNVGSAQIGFFDYFAIPHAGDTPQNDIGDYFNNAWILTGVNGTDKTDNGFPIKFLKDTGQPYVVVDSGDPSIVLAGGLFNIPFSASNEYNGPFDPVTICIQATDKGLVFTWTIGSEEPDERAVAQDASGYVATTWPEGFGAPPVLLPENSFPTGWKTIFPPPNFVDPFGNKAGPDPVWPLVLKVQTHSTAGGIDIDLSLKLPQTPMQMLENPSPLSCSDDDLRADKALSGGTLFAKPVNEGGPVGTFHPLSICEPDGFVAKSDGWENNITYFYFLCNKCSSTTDWMGWVFGIQVRDMGEIYGAPTLSTTEIPS